MYYNPGVIVDMVIIHPSGTNSTLFTACCGVAICDDEIGCPRCHRTVVGDDCPTDRERGKARHRNASRKLIKG